MRVVAALALGITLAACGSATPAGTRDGGGNDAATGTAGGSAGSSGGASGGAGSGGSGGAGATGHGGAGSGGQGGAGMGGHGGTAGGGGAPCGTKTCDAGGMCCYACISLCAAAGETCPVFIQDPCTQHGGTPDAGASCSDKQPTCAGGQVCDLDQPGRCAASTVSGTCITKPMICPLDYLPVCGCDRKTYSNDCERQAAGAQLDHAGAC